MEITLVFPHQLFADHPALMPGRTVVLLEDPLLFGIDAQRPLQVHRQRLLLHRATIKAYQHRLQKAGYEVLHRPHHLADSTAAHLQQLWESVIRCVHLADPVDDLLERRVKRFCEERNCVLELYPTPMILTPEDVLTEHFSSGKKPLLARFYELQRRRMGLLLDGDGGPLGGRWSFDADNRKKLPKGIEVPDPPFLAESSTIQQARNELSSEGVGELGCWDSFHYPVTHEDAAVWLEQFLDHRLRDFGAYEDAISQTHRVMWHSVLTPMMNIGLLTPQQVVDQTLLRAEAGELPLNSLEAFLRQIVGWREFMAAMYRRHGVTMRTSNFWGFEDRPIPAAFYTASTGLPPIDDAINHALNTGYCHHIERLMLLGNIMQLCGFHPTRVYNWFMEMFVDAFDWVMVPNVYGMSQFADGGLFTTKPYLSGSNYVRKMSDYRKGKWCEVWDGLFWSFIKRHENFFRGQYRLAMMARNLDRMADDTLKGHQSKALQFLDELT